MTKTKTMISEAVASTEVEALRTVIRRSWIESVKAIYAFGRAHTRAAIEASLTEYNMRLNSKGTVFTGAAKIAFSEQVDGVWTACNTYVSRYAAVCKYLDKNKVAVADVEAALEGRTMSSLTNDNSRVEIESEQFNKAVEAIKFAYSAARLFTFDDDKVVVGTEAGLQPGANFAVVVVGPSGEVEAIRRLGDQNDKHFRSKLWSVAKDDIKDTEETLDDLVEEAEAA